MSLYSSEQLAASAGKSMRTIRHHVKQGWLKPEPKFPGVRGWRFAESTAADWLALHYPGHTLSAVLPQPRLSEGSRSKSAMAEPAEAAALVVETQTLSTQAGAGAAASVPSAATAGHTSTHSTAAPVRVAAAVDEAAAPVRPRGAWKQSLHHESAHYVVAGVALCGARVPEGTPWHNHTTGLRRCTRCMPKALAYEEAAALA